MKLIHGRTEANWSKADAAIDDQVAPQRPSARALSFAKSLASAISIPEGCRGADPVGTIREAALSMGKRGCAE